MPHTYNLVATTTFGLEKFVGEEIDALGGKREKTIDGRVYFTGDENIIAKANICLRTAERVLIEVARFNAETFTELFENVKKVPWEYYIGKKDAFPVKGHSIKSKLYSVPDCQSIIKKAVVERLKATYKTDWFEETGVKYQIEFFIMENIVSVMIDTSGDALHKRGFVSDVGKAHIRETLAAALVKIARPRENVRLWDPFCGTGTIPIEAALIMTNTAPGLKRGFCAEKYGFLDKKAWKDAREEALAAVTKTDFYAFASDIDADVLKTAQINIKRAGMDKYIKVFQKDATTIEKDGVRTTIVCNPPYGERLGTIREARELYKKLGVNFSKLSPWQIYIITSEEEFESLYGKKADKVRKLYNGMIKCNYYQYFKNS
ncbi:MAG: class I SAM-dependent RNA methyltransferase [Clostridia bacterium]|nr:class I SAM-dependent RNA methyltransferase [Clostridia bacterium]